MNRGKFIVFEGGEGSGKSTILEMIYEYLIENNINCIKTREPGGIQISEDIRKIILDTKNTSMDGKTEALLYTAARRQHLVERVVPKLNDGVIVLCDRFIYSSLAYQGYARGIGMSDIYQINKFAVGEYMPDLNILFDVSPQIGLSRINKNKGREVNRLDLEKMDFHNKVREGYHKLYEGNKDKFIKIDAEKSIEEVFSEVKEIIINFIE
ncbi:MULTISPECIES: dTMP kinase [Clostridium]|jgi:dTMP kinase|uniref:Thymidylate kinase n=2 Tax=root TaxID=1 RepID=R9CEX8_9CLOT|nr:MULTISPECIES: dTMP kinase [Clostridium]EOR27894.1 thymidylate kinase Tmk [Clostridium sartagoforme AAU1]KLE17397.1 thymidylate kinase [Clostridium sp. C8]